MTQVYKFAAIDREILSVRKGWTAYKPHGGARSRIQDVGMSRMDYSPHAGDQFGCLI